MKVGFFYLLKTFFQKHRFGDKHVASTFDTVDIFNKMGTQQTLGSVSVDCISYFFTCDKSYFSLFGNSIKEYEIGSVPCFCSLFIGNCKLSTRFQASKLFYTANLFLPFDLRAAITFLPFFVFIRALKPCVLFLGVLCGWYVLFITNNPCFNFVLPDKWQF